MNMNDKTISTSIEILGKIYPIRCQESELQGLKEAANYLNDQMEEIQNSGKVINLERIAIIAALNIAHEFLQFDRQKSSFLSNINRKITLLQDKLEGVLKKNKQKDFIFSTE